jgi:hypothetical protein
MIKENKREEVQKDIMITQMIKKMMHLLYFHVRFILMKNISIMIVIKGSYIVHSVYYKNLGIMTLGK